MTTDERLRTEFGYREKHDLPSRFWEPEPPEDWQRKFTPEEEAGLEDLPFE